MKLRKGFTLAEILVALGIIGVMAALMATAFNGAKPDKTKVLYLKAYDALTEIVSTSVQSTELFKESYQKGSKEYDLSNFPLLDFTTPTASSLYNMTANPPESRVKSGKMKFANILKEMLNGEQISGCEQNSTKCTFDTNPGGYRWIVEARTNSTGIYNGNFPATSFFYYNHVEVRIGNNSSDSFAFIVYPDGNIDVVGQRGATYIKNRKNFRSKNDIIADHQNDTYIDEDYNPQQKASIVQEAGTTPIKFKYEYPEL